MPQSRLHWSVALLGVIAFILPEVALAQGETSYGGVGTIVVGFVQTLAVINTFMHLVLIEVLQMLGYLLQGDFFTDPVMMGALNTIWQLARNIMNVIFALAIIAVAIYTIVTAKTELIKQKWSHFVLAVILVNFSWFFPRVIIDVANIVAATVYSIPGELPGYTCKYRNANNEEVDCGVLTTAGPGPKDEFCPDAKAKFGDGDCDCLEDFMCYHIQTWEQAKTMRPAHKIINGMAVSFAKILYYVRVAPNIPGNNDGSAEATARITIQIALSVLMSFIVQLAILLALIGLGVGLFLRIIIMWVCVAFMPFTFIGVMKDGKPSNTVFGFNDERFDIWKNFISAAFLPAVVGIPMTIGFIMLGTVARIEDPNIGTMNIPLIPFVTSWWPLLWIFAAIGIMWTGTFAVLSTNKIVGSVTDKIKGFGDQAFQTAIKLPLLTPLPFPKGSGIDTIGDIPAKMRRFQAAVSQTTREGGNVRNLAENYQRLTPQEPITSPITSIQELTRKMTDQTHVENRMLQKLGDIRTAMQSPTHATPEAKAQAVKVIFQQMRTENFLPNITDDKQYAQKLLELKNNGDLPPEIRNRFNGIMADIETQLREIAR